MILNSRKSFNWSLGLRGEHFDHDFFTCWLFIGFGGGVKIGGYLPLFAHKEQDDDEADNEDGHRDGEDDDQVVKDAVISCKKKQRR